MAVRPEDVTITRGEVQGQISGDVRTIMVLGHFVEVNVEVENRQVIKTYVARNVADQLHMKDRVPFPSRKPSSTAPDGKQTGVLYKIMNHE